MMCWIPGVSGSFRPGALAIAGASGGASFFADSCKTGSEDDPAPAEAGAGEGALAAVVATGALDCRVCSTGSEDDGATAGVGAAGGASAARGSGAPTAFGFLPSEGAGAAGVFELLSAEGDGAAAGAAGGVDAGAGAFSGAGAGALTFAAAALFPAFCKASIKSSPAPWSWNFLARSGFIWKSTPRFSTI